MEIRALGKIDEFIWEIPKSFRSDMLVPARLYGSAELVKDLGKDRSLEQLINTATLPGIVRYALAMPDIHEGYGFPIGGVVATRTDEGIISPGGVGYDIGCGVRLLRSSVTVDAVKPKMEELATQIQRDVPSGLGQGGELKLGSERMDGVMERGASWMLEQGYGEEDDPMFCEAMGRIPEADPARISEHAKRRGRDQLGTIGSGNHFVEVDRVDEIFHEEPAKAFGLFKNQVVVLIHTGSRGLGHQVATDYIRLMMRVMPKYQIHLPDRELACAPVREPEGQQYYTAMNAAANFAFANRQFITHEVRKSWERIFGDGLGGLKVVYDVAHNMAKIEEHMVNGNKLEVCVHRKGATRAFGPGRAEIPAAYRGVGQPVLIPGSMGTASYVLVGQEQAMQESFGTACHGAGRLLSRKAAIRQIPPQALKQKMRDQGIVVRAGSVRGLVEEAPEAYKDVEEVVRVVDAVGIAKKVARLKPLAVIKG